MAALWLGGCATRQVASPVPSPSTPPPQAAAPAPVNPTAPLTVELAVERARARNPQIKALRAAIDVARQRKAAATDIDDPEALVGWGAFLDQFDSTASNAKGNNESRAGGRVYVPNPFLMVPRVNARSAEILAAKADLQAAQWLLECDVRRLFAELNYLGQDMSLAAELARDNTEIMASVRSRAQHGAATVAEVVAAAQRELEAQHNLDQSRHQYQTAQRDLAALLDLPPASVQIVTNAATRLSLPESALPIGPLQTVALASRGDVAASHWRTLAARSAYQEGLNGRIPWFKEVTAGNRQPSDQWFITIGVTVPVFTWTKNHAADVLQAQSELAAVNETNAVQLVRRELRTALDELEERQQQQVRNERETRPLLAEMRQTLQVLKATPNLVSSQVPATEAQILDTSRLELATRWEYQLALLNLERALGRPLSEVLPAILKKT
jgi:outer membrane protein TolC